MAEIATECARTRPAPAKRAGVLAHWRTGLDQLTGQQRSVGVGWACGGIAGIILFAGDSSRGAVFGCDGLPFAPAWSSADTWVA